MVRKPSKYSTIEMSISDYDKDLLSALFFQSGCAGIEESSPDHWRIYFSKPLSAHQQKSIINKLRNLFPSLDVDAAVFSHYDQRDWQAEWKKYFRPIRVTPRIWVAPPWDLPNLKKNGICLIIDPQMAFGTGSHESTQLMIRAMEKYVPSTARVLDVGTGSGILAILAKKLHVNQVLACDIEPEAIENAQHNARLNKVEDIEFQCGDLSIVTAADFDIILANINLNVLLNLIPKLDMKLRPQGLLILSGLLVVDENSILQAAAKHFKCIEKFVHGEWLALVLKKSPEN